MAKGPVKSVLDGSGTVEPALVKKVLNSMAKSNGRAALMDAIEGAKTEQIESQPATVDSTKESRAKAFSEWIQQGQQKFGCELSAFVVVEGITIPIPVRIVPK